MKKSCRQYEAELVELAEGQVRPGLENHLTSCPDCHAKFSALATILAAAKRGQYDAPAESLLRAQAIFTPQKRVIFASHLYHGAVGARASATQTGQVRLQAEDVFVTMMVRPEGKSWRVMGMIEGPLPNSISCGDETLPGDTSRFEFPASSLEDEVWLEYADRQIRFPLQLSE
jgi:hypothetical protein